MTTAHVILPNNGGKVNGGGKVLIRMAEILQELGYETTLEFSNGAPPEWLDIRIPITHVDRADLVIVCEVSFGWINKVQGYNLIYYQSPTYIERDQTLRPITYQEQGAQGVFFNSQWNRTRYVQATGEDGPIVHPSVDANMFFCSNELPLNNRVVYFPRKNLGLAHRVMTELEQGGIVFDWMAADEIPETELAQQWRYIGVTMITGYPESFPMPPIEAMASGSVVVGTHGGGGLEYMEHAKNCLLVADGNWKSLVRAMEQIQNDRVLRHHLQERGRQTAQRFSPQNQRKELQEALVALHAPLP